MGHRAGPRKSEKTPGAKGPDGGRTGAGRPAGHVAPQLFTPAAFRPSRRSRARSRNGSATPTIQWRSRAGRERAPAGKRRDENDGPAAQPHSPGGPGAGTATIQGAPATTNKSGDQATAEVAGQAQAGGAGRHPSRGPGRRCPHCGPQQRRQASQSQADGRRPESRRGASAGSARGPAQQQRRAAGTRGGSKTTELGRRRGEQTGTASTAAPEEPRGGAAGERAAAAPILVGPYDMVPTQWFLSKIAYAYVLMVVRNTSVILTIYSRF